MWPRPNAKGKRPFYHFYQRKLCASFSGLWFAKTFWEFLVNSSYLIVKLSAMQLLRCLQLKSLISEIDYFLLRLQTSQFDWHAFQPPDRSFNHSTMHYAK